MYQSVDDIDETGNANASPQALNRLKVSAIILFGLTLLMIAAIYSAQSSGPNTDAIDQYAEQKVVYIKAMTERDPALRRARLLDFVQTYPKHDRAAAAQAQLGVVQAAEAKDWAALTDVVYDPDQSHLAKLAALQLYDNIWGIALLGGREDDMARLKVLLGQADKDAAQEDSQNKADSQDFTPPPDRFDDSVNGTEMAGGVVIAKRTYIPPNRRVEILTQQRGVVPPKVRKNVRPRYPSRALRRGYGAEIILALNIDDEGKVQMTELISARARKYRKDFIKASERAALKTRFHPKTVNGRPVAAMGVTKRFVFRVEE